MYIAVDGSVFVDRLTGIGNYSYQLLKAIAHEAEGVRFVVLSNRPLCVDFDEPTIRVKVCRSLFAINDHVWKVLGLGISARREAVDLLWASNGVGPLISGLSVLLPVYDFVYLRERATMSLKSRWFRSISQPFWIRRARAVFTISDAVDDELRQFFGRAADSIIKPAVEGSFFRRNASEVLAIRKRYGLDEEYLLTVGTLEPRKNVSAFVKEFLAFRADHAAEKMPQLVLVGGKGWNDKEIESAVSLAEAQGAVRRVGYVPTEDLPGLYSGAKAFFMPSRYEGFGMPLLEARSCGCPVVCSDVPAMREAAGDSAFFHAPDRKGIRMALEEVLVAGRLPESDGAAGVNWTWESGARQLSGLLGSLAEAGAVARTGAVLDKGNDA